MAASSSAARAAVVAVGGATGTGKTALAVALARRFGGEVISADSMQVYTGLDIGTAKATLAERQGVAHHLIDIRTPEQAFSVADFTAAASACIRDIAARGRLPIVAGGTGLYITSLLQGIEFAPQKADPALRRALQGRWEAEGPAALYAELCAVDPDYAAALHENDAPRILRALELYAQTGRKMSEQRRAARPAQPPFRSVCLCLACRDRQALYRRTDARVDAMLAAGLVGEARTVWQNRAAYTTAAQAIGYKEFFPYFAGTASLEDCVRALKTATRRYAKRQLTWFRHQTDAVWLFVDEGDPAPAAFAAVEAFLRPGA